MKKKEWEQLEKEIDIAQEKFNEAIRREFPIGSITFYMHGNRRRIVTIVTHDLRRQSTDVFVSGASDEIYRMDAHRLISYQKTEEEK